MDDLYAETDLLLAEHNTMDVSMKYRNGANGTTTEGRSSTVSTDDELLDIGDGRMAALENWADTDELEPKYSSKILLFCKPVSRNHSFSLNEVHLFVSKYIFVII